MLHVSSNISCDSVTCVSLFNLHRPRDFTSPTSRRGTLYYYVYNEIWFRNTKVVSSGRESFLVLSVVGRAGGPRCKCGSRPGSLARARGVRSREIWQVDTRSISEEPSPIKFMGNPWISTGRCCNLESTVSVSATAVQLRHGLCSRLSRCTTRTGHGSYCLPPSVCLHSELIPLW